VATERGADRRTPGVTTADRILDAAESLFAERGRAGTAVRDIAARADLTPASLYNHFASKQELYEAVLERGIRPLVEILERAAAADPGPGFADEIIETVMEQLGKTPHLPRLIQHEAVAGGEHLARLAKRFILPPVTQAMAAARRDASATSWEDDELPLLVAAWLNMIFGHFSMAPLLGEVFGFDPLEPDQLARQTRFLRKLAQRL
jgi:AcrR family transcriptional regulator